MYYVYIIKWNTYYVWVTNNLERRFKEHRNKQSYFTKRIWDNIKMLGYFEFENKIDAMKLEKEIKRSWHIKRYLDRNLFIRVSSSAG